MEFNENFWRVCSSCKKQIQYATKYFECSVSTCTGKRTGYVFCTVPCWERHLPGARHRDAAAVEVTSPTRDEWKREVQPAEQLGTRRIVTSPTGPSSATPVRGRSAMDNEVLVVVSKMKQFISDHSQMNTSADVAQVLSQMIRLECLKAIDQARCEGRKTVMARDFDKKS